MKSRRTANVEPISRRFVIDGARDTTRYRPQLSPRPLVAYSVNRLNVVSVQRASFRRRVPAFPPARDGAYLVTFARPRRPLTSPVLWVNVPLRKTNVYRSPAQRARLTGRGAVADVLQDGASCASVLPTCARRHTPPPGIKKEPRPFGFGSSELLHSIPIAQSGRVITRQLVPSCPASFTSRC